MILFSPLPSLFTQLLDLPFLYIANLRGGVITVVDSRSNTNINDVLGDYCLTLVDALDTLAVSEGLNYTASTSGIRGE